jgi:hypothetical protein
MEARIIRLVVGVKFRNCSIHNYKPISNRKNNSTAEFLVDEKD